MLRIAGSFLVLFLISSVAGPQNPTAPPWDLQSAVHYFDYDSAQPLAIQDKVVQETSDFTIHDITYASPKGGRVPAYLIVPKGKGPFAAILFGHYGLGTRSEFIPEGKLYAKAGAVSLIPDYPWDRPEPWHKTVDHFDKPELDRAAYIQTVIDLRRGIDLLLARSDVDPKRLAYIGHSYGAQWGSILSAVDKRMKASVLMAGVAEAADIFLRNDDPGLTDLKKSQPPGQLEKYVQATSDLDALRYVGHAAPVTLLLQFANFERYFDKTSEQHYIDDASEPKKVLWYDTGHELNDPQALRDRYAWLASQIALNPGLKP
jgi:dienelactone hydrolase